MPIFVIAPRKSDSFRHRPRRDARRQTGPGHTGPSGSSSAWAGAGAHSASLLPRRLWQPFTSVNGQLVVFGGSHVNVLVLAVGWWVVGVLVLASCAVFEAVAVAGCGDDVGVVAEAVEEADGGWLVG